MINYLKLKLFWIAFQYIFALIWLVAVPNLVYINVSIKLVIPFKIYIIAKSIRLDDQFWRERIVEFIFFFWLVFSTNIKQS